MKNAMNSSSKIKGAEEERKKEIEEKLNQPFTVFREEETTGNQKHNQI